MVSRIGGWCRRHPLLASIPGVLALCALALWIFRIPLMAAYGDYRLDRMRGAAASRPLVAPFDAPARRAAIAVEDIAFTGCPAIPPPQRQLPDIERFYTDDKESVPDPAKWDAALAKLRNLRLYGIRLGELNSAAISDRNPDPARAECMVRFLETWATAGALTGEPKMMTSSNRAWFLLVNAATTLIILKQDGSIDAARARPIEQWLQTLAWSVIDFDNAMYAAEKDPSRYPNNHVYWAGAAAAAVAVAAQDKQLFLVAMDYARAGLEQVDADGYLSGELWRGARAFDYTMFGAAPLGVIVLYAEANGVDLASVNDGALLRLVRTTAAAPATPAEFERRAGARRETAWNAWPAYVSDLAFVEIALAVKPDPGLERLIAPYRPLFSQNLGGDLTLIYAPPKVARKALETPGKRLPSPPL